MIVRPPPDVPEVRAALVLDVAQELQRDGGDRGGDGGHQEFAALVGGGGRGLSVTGARPPMLDSGVTA